MKVRWMAVSMMLAAYVAGGLSFWLYESLSKNQERVLVASQQAELARQRALVEVQCPTEVHEADLAAIAHAQRNSDDGSVVERGGDQRGYGAFLNDAWVVAGELSISQGGERPYRLPIRYIRKPYGTIDILYGRTRDAEFEDLWAQIVSARLCVVYD